MSAEPLPSVPAGHRRIVLLGAALGAIVLSYLIYGLDGFDGFLLSLRLKRLLALLLVAIAVAFSTLPFQTLTNNRLITPSIMGLDAFFVAGQSALVLILGGFGVALIDPRLKFLLATGLMVFFALGFLLPLLRARIDMTLLLLCGAVIGLFFRSVGDLLGRLIDPNEFAFVQAASFASISHVRADTLMMAAVMVGLCCILIWRSRHAFDVIALGRDHAVSLGLDWTRQMQRQLGVVAVLVAVTTALVGPVVFLGLLVSALTDRVIPDWHHASRLPAAAIIAALILVSAHGLLQFGLGGASSLGIIIECLGGLTFLLLLLHKARP